MRIMRCLLLLAFTAGFSAASAQSLELEQVPGPISGEAYDLFIDKKGLLWIAHNGGISSYDGRNYRHYTNPLQISPAMTGLCEDSKGRIWCYNFNGQVWYVENGRLHLLQDFEYEKEPYFPRITIWGDLLLIPSIRGAFVYDTKNDKGKYISFPNQSNCVAALKDQAIFLSSSGKKSTNKYHTWTLLNKTGKLVGGIKEVKGYPSGGPIILQPTVFNNQIYIIQNPEKSITRSVIKDSYIIRNDSVRFSSFINTVTENRGTVWIHGKTHSSTWDQAVTITGKNLSDIITDREGNTWASSLSFGLLKAKKTPPPQLEKRLGIKNGNFITTILYSGYNNIMVAGTASGETIVFDAAEMRIVDRFMYRQGGTVERLFHGTAGEVMIGYSVGLKKYEASTKRISTILSNVTPKDIYLDKNYLIVASATHLLWKTLLQPSLSDGLRLLKKQFPSLSPQDTLEGFLEKSPMRTNGACLLKDTLFFTSLKTGVFKTTPSGTKQLYFNKTALYATTILPVDEMLIIGSHSHGVLLWEKDTIRQLTAPGKKNLTGVYKLKKIGSEVFVFTRGGLYRYNILRKNIVHFSVAELNDMEIVDLDMFDNNYFLVTQKGAFIVPVTQTSKEKTPILTPLYCIVNYADTLNFGTFNIPHNQNNLSFHFTFPWYDAPTQVDLGYRLFETDNSDTSWLYINSSLDQLNLPALQPGSYRLELKAKNNYNSTESPVIQWRFTISPPWWKTPLFLFSFLLAGSLLIFFFVKDFLRRKLVAQQQAYEKQLAVEMERNRISKEMHDDIGAGLSGIKLMAELTRSETNDPETAGELDKLTESVSDIAARMKEAIWSLNTANDNLVSLYSFLEKQLKDQLKHFPSKLIVTKDTNIPALMVKGDVRRNVYLVAKEAVNNIIKHSGAQQITIRLGYAADTMNILIQDNGKGFDTGDTYHNGNGIRNMKERITAVGGTLELTSSADGSIIEIRVPLTTSV